MNLVNRLGTHAKTNEEPQTRTRTAHRAALILGGV